MLQKMAIPYDRANLTGQVIDDTEYTLLVPKADGIVSAFGVD